MTTHKTSLLNLLSDLQNAIESQDWSAGEAIDRAIKLELQAAISKADEDAQRNELLDILTKVQSLYSQLITSSEQSRSNLSSELKKISNENKAANSYLQSSQYR